MRVAALVATLFIFWLLLSGIYTPFLVLSGLAASTAVAALAWRMEVADREGHPIHLTLGAVAPRLPISPTLARFKPSQSSVVGLVTHANSITLTPGTLTVEADREAFLVHALTRAGADGLAGSEMDRRVSRMEGGA